MKLSSLNYPHQPRRRDWQVLRLPQRLSAVVLLAFALGSAVNGQTGERVLAEINGKRITFEEVERLVIAQTLPLEEKLYAIRKAALENVITGRVLEDEAKKRGISVAELRKQLMAGEVEVSQKQVEEAYAENASFFASMSPDEAKERLRLDLENQQRMQNYRTRLAELRAGAKVELFLNEPRLPLIVDDRSAASTGPADAAITLVEFSDFQCPYCRDVQTTLRQVLQRYGKQIRLVFKHLPQLGSTHAFLASQAAYCASEQSKFWQYHDALFATNDLTNESLDKIARDIGLNLSLFQKCLSADSSAAAIRANLREASQLGINSTPTFVINGRVIRGAADLSVFTLIFDSELSSAKTSSQFRTSQPARKE
jgi:predicted DsbA family dithiol-disulfide isomerase